MRTLQVELSALQVQQIGTALQCRLSQCSEKLEKLKDKPHLVDYWKEQQSEAQTLSQMFTFLDIYGQPTRPEQL